MYKLEDLERTEMYVNYNKPALEREIEVDCFKITLKELLTVLIAVPIVYVVFIVFIGGLKLIVG